MSVQPRHFQVSMLGRHPMIANTLLASSTSYPLYKEGSLVFVQETMGVYGVTHTLMVVWLPSQYGIAVCAVAKDTADRNTAAAVSLLSLLIGPRGS